MCNSLNTGELYSAHLNGSLCSGDVLIILVSCDFKIRPVVLVIKTIRETSGKVHDTCYGKSHDIATNSMDQVDAYFPSPLLV